MNSVIQVFIDEVCYLDCYVYRTGIGIMGFWSGNSFTLQNGEYKMKTTTLSEF